MSFSKDFYSHSNWIELGKREPYSNLIKPDTPISNIAGKWSRCGYAHISLPISETVFLVPWLLKYFQFWFEWSTVNYTFEKLLSFVSVKRRYTLQEDLASHQWWFSSFPLSVPKISSSSTATPRLLKMNEWKRNSVDIRKCHCFL